MSLLSLIEEIDIIGKKPRLILEKRERHKTVLGGLWSILIYLLFILCFLFFGQEYVYWENPTIVLSYDLNLLSDPIGFINQTTSPDDLSIQFPFWIKTDPELPLILSKFDIEKRNQPTFSSSFSECNSHSLEILDSIMKSSHNLGHAGLNLQQYSSMKTSCLNQDENISIDHYETDKIHEQILITMIKNSQDDPIPHAAMTPNDIILFYIDTLVNERNKTDPFLTLIKDIKTSFGHRINIELQRELVYTDIGIIFTIFELKKSVSVKSIADISIASKDTIEVNIIISEINRHYYRKYIKLQLILAELGGIMKAFLLIASNIHWFYSNTRYYERLISRLFDGDDLFRNSENEELIKSKKNYRDSIALKHNYKLAENKKESFVMNNNFLVSKTNTLKEKKKEKASETNMSRINHNLSIKAQYNKSSNNDQSMSNLNEKKSENYFENEEEEKDFKCVRTNNIRHMTTLNNAQFIHNLVIPTVNNNNNLPRFNSNMNNNNNNTMLDNCSNSKKISQTHSNNNTNKDNKDGSEPRCNHRTLSHGLTHNDLKENKLFKHNFDKIRNQKFMLSNREVWEIICCTKEHKRKSHIRKKARIFKTGTDLINSRIDFVTLVKKNLDFDRFKYLMLKENELLLINSLSKFLLEPEKLNLTDFNTISYERFIETLVQTSKGGNFIEKNLTEIVKQKYQIEIGTMLDENPQLKEVMMSNYLE